jgi:hypothetical protein
MGKTYKVESWNELMDILFVESWNEEIRRFRSPYAFRGLPENYKLLQSSIVSLKGNYAEMEKHLLRNFRKYAHKDIVEKDTIWNWISLAKHYNLPTRLIDWTYSPFTALHFATHNIAKMNIDSIIWCANYKAIHTYLPPEFRELLTAEGSDVFTIEMLSQKVNSLNEFDAISDKKVLLFFEPPSIDERISNQYALFSLITDARMDHSEWLNEHPKTFFKVIIPASLKWEIRDKLDQLNINERILFPGLDGLSKWLKRMYSSKED